MELNKNSFAFRLRENWHVVGLVFVIMMALSVYMVFARGLYIYEGDRTLYCDDLEVHDIMTNPNTTFWEKMTDISSNKNRYLTNTMLAVFWKFVGNRHGALVNKILMLSNLGLMAVVFFALFFCLDIRNSSWRALLAGGGTFLFVSSRFAYYSYEEIFGLMENLATGFTIIILACLWKDNFKFKKFFLAANILYPFVIYTHERYAVLAGVIAAYCFLACVWNDERISKKTFLRAVPAVLMFAFFMGQRIFLFKNRFLDGTGGIDAIETFNIKTFFFMVSKCVFYLMGVGAPGDAYLSGIPVTSVPLPVYLCTAFLWAFCIMTFVLFAKAAKDSKKNWLKYIFCLLALVFLCGICSTTIRIEMRWMYAPLCILIFFVVNMFAVLLEKGGAERRRALSLAGALALLMGVAVENFYVRHWTGLYNWNVRINSRNLTKRLSKSPLLIDTLYIISEHDLDEYYVLRTLELAGRKYNKLVHLNDFKDIDFVNDNDVVLFSLEGMDDYYDVTKVYGKIRPITGLLHDGWTEPYCKLRVYSQKENGSLNLSFYLPNYKMFGNNNELVVKINGQEKGRYKFDLDSSPSIKVDGLKKGENFVELDSSFWIIENSGRPDASDDRLSFVLTHISVDYK